MEIFSKKFGFVEENIPTIVQFLLDEVQNETPKEDIFIIVNEKL